MIIKILSIGKTKEKFIVAGEEKYIHLIGINNKIELVNLKEEKILKNSNIQNLVNMETDRVMAWLDKNAKGYVTVLLSVLGKEMNSIEFSELLTSIGDYRGGKVIFLIGGAFGFNEKISKIVDYEISFSKLTFTHEMIRLFLLEQIYRAKQIEGNTTYHK